MGEYQGTGGTDEAVGLPEYGERVCGCGAVCVVGVSFGVLFAGWVVGA